MERDMRDCFKVVPLDNENEKFVIVIGKHLATEEIFDSREKAEDRLDRHDWNLIAGYVCALQEALGYEEKINENKEEVK